MDKDQLKFYAEWYHGAILELLALESSKDDPEWLSKTLIPKITPTKAQQSLELLQKIGFLVFDDAKKNSFPLRSIFPQVRK